MRQLPDVEFFDDGISSIISIELIQPFSFHHCCMYSMFDICLIAYFDSMTLREAESLSTIDWNNSFVRADFHWIVLHLTDDF